MRVMIIGGDRAYSKMWLAYGHKEVRSTRDADIVQFCGGADVTPSYYGETKHPRTMNSPHQDKVERDIYEICVKESIPMVGICRGGQFLNVMNGGKMYQHVTNHGLRGTHELTDARTGEKVRVSSTHHQMMRPGITGEVIAYAEGLASTLQYMVGESITDAHEKHHKDTEVVWYEETTSLCFQPHPEFSVYAEEVVPCADYYFKLIEELI